MAPADPSKISIAMVNGGLFRSVDGGLSWQYRGILDLSVQGGEETFWGPEIVLLDEPFSGLDPMGADAMAGILRDRAAAGAAPRVQSARPARRGEGTGDRRSCAAPSGAGSPPARGCV